MLTIVEYIASFLPYAFAARDSGIDVIDARLIREYLNTWAEAHLPKEK